LTTALRNPRFVQQPVVHGFSPVGVVVWSVGIVQDYWKDGDGTHRWKIKYLSDGSHEDITKDELISGLTKAKEMGCGGGVATSATDDQEQVAIASAVAAANAAATANASSTKTEVSGQVSMRSRAGARAGSAWRTRETHASLLERPSIFSVSQVVVANTCTLGVWISGEIAEHMGSREERLFQ
jgi:hypothetical protein